MSARDLPPLHASPAALGKVVCLAHSKSNYVHFYEDDRGPAADMCVECNWVDDHSPTCPIAEQERAQRIENGDECEKCGGRDIEFSDAITPLFHCRKCQHSRFDFRGDEA